MLRLRGLAPVWPWACSDRPRRHACAVVITPAFLSTYNLFVTGRDLSILLLVALVR